MAKLYNLPIVLPVVAEFIKSKLWYMNQLLNGYREIITEKLLILTEPCQSCEEYSKECRAQALQQLRINERGVFQFYAEGIITSDKFTYTGSWSEQGLLCGVLNFFGMSFDGEKITVNGKQYPAWIEDDGKILRYQAGVYRVRISLDSFDAVIEHHGSMFYLSLLAQPSGERKAEQPLFPFLSVAYSYIAGIMKEGERIVHIIIPETRVVQLHYYKVYYLNVDEFWQLVESNKNDVISRARVTHSEQLPPRLVTQVS